jgi:dihydroorotase
VLVSSLVEPGIVDYATLVDKMAVAPARIFGLPGGTLRRGAPADVTVFDPTRRWEVDPARFVSKGRNSPWGGRTLTGRVLYTVVDGRVVHRSTDGAPRAP